MNFDFAKCPECGSYNLVFGDITWNDDTFEPQIQQEASCGDCGCEFLELHNTSYERTKITTPGTGENTPKYRRCRDCAALITQEGAPWCDECSRSIYEVEDCPEGLEVEE